EPGDALAAVPPELLGTPEDRGASLVADGAQPQHGDGVGDDVQHPRPEPEGERAVERVGTVPPELLVAARAACRGARREGGQVLDEVAVGARHQPGVGDGLVVARRIGVPVHAGYSLARLFRWPSSMRRFSSSGVSFGRSMASVSLVSLPVSLNGTW